MTMPVELAEPENEFDFDLRRCCTLPRYIEAWQFPTQRRLSQPPRLHHRRLEVYDFPCVADDAVRRVATVGLGAVSGDQAGRELMMALPKDWAGASWSEVADFLLDIAVHAAIVGDIFREGATVPPTALMPRSWSPRALAVLAPLGEPETTASFHCGTQHVDLLWIVPIYESEFAQIRRDGIGWFYDAMDASDDSPVWPDRDPFV